MSKLPKKTRDKYCKKNLENRQHYISRITKTLYYAKLPQTEGLSLPVTELAAELFSEAQRGRSLDRLHCDDAANISRNACVSPCSLVIALLYLERLKKSNPEYLERTASSDLFLVSLMVSCKFLYDDGETDEVFIDEWALTAGTTVKRLVQLEREFLKAIDWEIFVNGLTFWRKLNQMETAVARKQGILRGFFTYTELESLLTTINLQNLVQIVAAVSAILIASYTAALFTLFGSVFIVSHIPGACLQQKKIEIPQNTTLLDLPIIQQSSISDQNENIVLDLNIEKSNQINSLTVLKTGMFLASVEGFLKPFCNRTDELATATRDNIQNSSWDWWNVPTLKWLTQYAAVDSNEMPNFQFSNFYDRYLNVRNWGIDTTNILVEENLWHGKWTDPLDTNGFYNRYLHYYIQTVKS